MRILAESICRREAIIDRFEEAWLSGGQPKIADFVEECRDDCEALREILLVDIEWRRARRVRRGFGVCPRFPRVGAANGIDQRIEGSERGGGVRRCRIHLSGWSKLREVWRA